MGRSTSREAVSAPPLPLTSDVRLMVYHRGLYDPGLEKDACGVGFAWLVSPCSSAQEFGKLTLNAAI
jgi:hypothetical protein